jgi:AcrR family transcriptional regulator
MNQTMKSEVSLRGRSKGRAVVRDKQATTASILSAAEAEFARYGLQGTRVEAIASAAGVTKGLIFHYFENKEHLFEAVLSSASEPVRAVLAEVDASDASPADLLRLLLERFLQAVTERPLAHLVFTLEGIQNNGEHYRKLKLPSLYKTIEHLLAKGVKQGCFRDLDTTHAAINIVGLCMFYFCSANVYPAPDLKCDPFDKEVLAHHAREVMRFVEASTAVVKE